MRISDWSSDVCSSDLIFFIGKAQVLFRRDVAQHGSAVPADQRSTDSRRNMVIARSNISCQRPQGIEGSFMAMLQLHVHVFLDQVHGYVSGSLDHALTTVLPLHLC